MLNLQADSTRFAPNVPIVDVPFLAAFRVQHGPPGFLGRFFLNAHQRLIEAGLTPSFITFDRLANLYETHAANWGTLIPLFDDRRRTVPRDAAFCLVVRDRTGDMVGTISARLYQTGPDRNLRDLIEDGTLLGIDIDRAAAKPTICEITAPVATRLHGRLVYCGALWVEPRYRGMRLAAILPRLAHACFLTLWNPDHMIGLLTSDVVGSDLQHRYGYVDAEPGFRYVNAGRAVYEGYLVWKSAPDLTDDLRRFIDELWPQIDAGAVARNAQQST